MPQSIRTHQFRTLAGTGFIEYLYHELKAASDANPERIGAFKLNNDVWYFTCKDERWSITFNDGVLTTASDFFIIIDINETLAINMIRGCIELWPSRSRG